MINTYQLLTSVCSVEPEGATKVLEAMSVMRIVFGESVRFKLLTSLVMNSSLNSLEGICLGLINALLSKSPSTAERVRLQSELQESGLDVKFLERKFKPLPPEDKAHAELRKWKETYIDLTKVFSEKRSMNREIVNLKEEIEVLHSTITVRLKIL
jgi:hypothetical protein